MAYDTENSLRYSHKYVKADFCMWPRLELEIVGREVEEAQIFWKWDWGH